MRLLFPAVGQLPPAFERNTAKEYGWVYLALNPPTQQWSSYLSPQRRTVYWHRPRTSSSLCHPWQDAVAFPQQPECLLRCPVPPAELTGTRPKKTDGPEGFRSARRMAVPLPPDPRYWRHQKCDRAYGDEGQGPSCLSQVGGRVHERATVSNCGVCVVRSPWSCVHQSCRQGPCCGPRAAPGCRHGVLHHPPRRTREDSDEQLELMEQRKGGRREAPQSLQKRIARAQPDRLQRRRCGWTGHPSGIVDWLILPGTPPLYRVGQRERGVGQRGRG